MAEYMHVRGILNEKILQPDSVFHSTSFIKAHPTVAFFTSSPGGTFTFEKWQMWRGIAEVAQERGMNLLYVAGEEFEYSPQAVLYDLVGKHNVDGIILWNSFFSRRSTIEKTHEFVARYSGLPIVSIELPLKDACNLMIDNYQAMRDILAHLVEAHGYRRIAFLDQADSYTSRSRQHAFEQIMMEYGSYDPSLVGNLAELDKRGMRPGVDYQAIVAHADSLAVTAVDELQSRGVRVPDDVAVTGFNDGMEARGLLPPLTTARLPFRKLGREAVEILIQWIGGQKPDVQMVMPAQLILRRSCGCLEPLAEGAVSPVSMITADKTLGDALAHQRSEIIAEMAVSMGAPNDSLSNSWAEGLFDSFSDELNRLSKCCTRSSSQDYLIKMNSLLRQAVEEGVNVSRWHDALSALRRHLRPYLNGEDLSYAEDLWQQARVLIGQSAIRGEVHRNWKTSQRSDEIRALEAGMMTSVDFNELLDVLSSGLPRLGIFDFCLVLYEDQFKPDGWARLILVLKDGKRINIDAEKQRFQPKDILPHDLLCQSGPCCLVVEALNIREEQLGYMVFRNSPPPDAYNCEIYQALHIQLSNAIKEVRLRQKLQDALQQAEEANLLKSRFLSMVSHELRTPINLIVGLSEMAMRQQNHDRKASLEVLQKFNEQIYISGQHLDRLIRDVLDLASSQAGQMSLICTTLDLAPVLQDAICIGNQLAEQKSLQFQSNIPEVIPQVWGDKTRLRQILLNLINNAVKFTAHGEIRLTVKVESGEILISVEDTGLGIAKEEQESIFDEFHQSDRTAVRGYGGIGLGLAITRRLVEMHGGRIWVTSHGWEGSGSNFCFTLPVMQPVDAALAPVHQVEEEEMKEANGHDGTVMVLTKTCGSAENLIVRLNQHGFAVQEMALEDHPNFFDELIASPPGAVVLDMAPASEQGWEIMKKLKEGPSTQDVPVLFYSLLTNEDSGSVFEMDFLTKPVGADQLIQALERHGINSNRKNTKTILMIDDEPGMLDLHARMVKSALSDCQVQTAQSGIQGLQMMRKEQPDLVLLDLMMPELDGFGVLKAMQEEQMLRNIPVVILSAQVLTRREIDRLNQRVAAVLGKGLFTAKETITRIESALSRNKRLGSESQRLVHHGMAYIHEHFRGPISRVDIANHLSVNEQYLSRCFNKEIGIGPMAYLGRYRILQAKRLLEIGTMSITQVALEVGFSSQSYFSRIFQQETGITPTDYQNGARPSPE
jgi:signal transduction histidine kinase/DNA-binding LacI/PurR family transcriptional regulator/DNA-binding response OmpR family regulator